MHRPDVLPRILLCDDDSLLQMAVKHALKGIYEVTSAYNTDEAKVLLRNRSYDLLLLDIQMRTEDEGLRALPEFNELDPDLPILMISGRTDFLTLREAMRLGARDYVPKDFEPEDLKLTLHHALERRSLLLRREQQDYELRQGQSRLQLTGLSPQIARLREQLPKIRDSSIPVLISGETGTGKERIARLLRRNLPDGTLEPFVAVDSSTLSSGTAESLLFGHEKGAFSGADRLHRGFFEEAHGGTIFLDEVGNLPAEVQPKLLRVLQEKEILRVGATRPIHLDFRVISATNRSLYEEAARGNFKADLFQRLNGVSVELPPLRERLEDLPHLLAELSPHLKWTEETFSVLRRYRWPGNIRELENLVRWLETFAPDGIHSEICPTDLPPRLVQSATASNQNNPEESFYELMAKHEREALKASFTRHGGNVSRMATALKMDRSHLHSKLKAHGIRSDEGP